MLFGYKMVSFCLDTKWLFFTSNPNNSVIKRLWCTDENSTSTYRSVDLFQEDFSQFHWEFINTENYLSFTKHAIYCYMPTR